MYVDYVKTFANPTVVFDGYASGPTTKDMTHRRRSHGMVGPNVLFRASMSLKSKKEHFLANTENKQNFIHFLCKRLEASNIETSKADGDADTLIAQTGVERAKLGVTHVIGEDTDILVLLCHYVQPGMHDLIFRSDKLKRPDKTNKPTSWDIKRLRQRLGDQLSHVLPFIHAVGGCDTTSSLYGVGKGVPLKNAGGFIFPRASRGLLPSFYKRRNKGCW